MPLSAPVTKTINAITVSKTTWYQPGTRAYSYYFAESPCPWAEGRQIRHVQFRKVQARRRRHAIPVPTATPSSPQVTQTPRAVPSMKLTASPAPSASRPAASSSGLTPQPTAEYQTPTGRNQFAWSKAILRALGDPLTRANVRSIGYWMQNEAGKPPYGIVGANNPLNASEPGYGGWPIQFEAPGYYLRSYPTVRDGLEATAAYLNNGSYPGILSALKAGVGLSDPSLTSEIQLYSGDNYSTIPDSWGQSQGMPPS
jgi:hypothetical protein